MRKNSLVPNKGLSLSQAQSVSNLCNQSAIEIGAVLIVVNNLSKTVSVDGVDKTTVTGKPLPTNLVELLKKKAGLHACQAFLMENIKAKDVMLKAARTASADLSAVVLPERPVFVDPIVNSLAQVGEDWG